MKFKNNGYSPRPDSVIIDGNIVNTVKHNSTTVWINTNPLLGATDTPTWSNFNSTSPHSGSIYYYLNPFELTQDDIELNVTDISYNNNIRNDKTFTTTNQVGSFTPVFRHIKKHPKTGAFEFDAKTGYGTTYGSYNNSVLNTANIELPELVVDSTRHYAYSMWLKPDFAKSSATNAGPNVGVFVNSSLSWGSGSAYNSGHFFRIYAGLNENEYNGQTNSAGWNVRSNFTQMVRYNSGLNMTGSGCPGWDTYSSTYFIHAIECDTANDLVWRDINGIPSWSNSKWVHYMITRTGLNGHILKIYRDGLLIGQSWSTTSSSYEWTINGSYLNNSYRSQKLLIGAYAYDSSYKKQYVQSRYCGQIGEFVAFRGAEFSDADVWSIYSNKSNFYSNLDLA